MGYSLLHEYPCVEIQSRPGNESDCQSNEANRGDSRYNEGSH